MMPSRLSLRPFPFGRCWRLAAVLVALAAPILNQTSAGQPAAANPEPPPRPRSMDDWANLSRYQSANAALPAPARGEERVVFMGDSITDAWPRIGPFFAGKPYLGRGIGGQTTPQMLVRFRADVVALQPRVVVLLAGINDIAGNTGPSTLAMIQDNLRSMVEIAQANGIRVVLASILPALDFPWRPGLQPAAKVVAMNTWIKVYAESHSCIYLDYFTALADERGGLRAEFAEDGIHPTRAGYAVMEPLAAAAIARALAQP
jgi:lysophospholipase L1-like esterase